MPFINLINTLLNLYSWVLIIAVLLNLLLTFNVINGHNELVRTIYRFCISLTEPLLKPIRRKIPPISGIDISPVILILLIEFIRQCLWWYLVPLVIHTPL